MSLDEAVFNEQTIMMRSEHLLMSAVEPEKPSLSVVIPAHNEESVIARCLSTLLTGARPGELEIVVVCNGCSDRTGDIARMYGREVMVIETPIPSKIHALNLGDRAATAFPRFFLDADIAVSVNALRATAALMAQRGALAGSPKVEWDLSGCSRLVRAFYAVWRLQPYFDTGCLGAGLYGMTAAGHERLSTFPDITADDEYVRRLFAPHERVTPQDFTFRVTAPKTLSDLVKIKTRSRRGNMELARKFPQLTPPKRDSRSQFALRLLSRPWLWPAAFVYLYVVLRTSIRAKKTLNQQRQPVWERDLSSRPSQPIEEQKLVRT